MILLHGLGGARDLPLPVSATVLAATAAVAATFIILSRAWRTAHFEGPGALVGHQPRWLAALDSTTWSRLLAGAGLLFFGWCTWALIAGADANINPTFGVFYVWVWVGIVPLSLLFGRVARALSPWRALVGLGSFAMGTDPKRGLLPYPTWLGFWPAAFGVLAFTWQELVNPDQVALASLQIWLAVYATAMIAGSIIFGTEWLSHADPFEAYSNLLAQLSIWGRDVHGRLIIQSPLRHLASLPTSPGLLALTSGLFGSTIYDSGKDSPAWNRFIDTLPLGPVTVGTLSLLAAWGIVAVTFWAAASMNGPPGVPARQRSELLAGSLVPLIAGYMTAHYLSYFVLQGQITLAQISDPLSTGANYLGTANMSPNLWLMQQPTVLASLKALAIVAAHVVGAVAAHDRSVWLRMSHPSSDGRRIPAGVPMAVMMVVYTTTGLLLLFGG